jgi:hypothetical protein
MTNNDRVIVGFSPTQAEWQAGRHVLIATGHASLAEEPRREFGYVLKFDSTADFDRFVNEVKTHGLSPDSYFVRTEKRVSPRGLESPLVWLQVTSSPSGLGGPTYGTQYDLARGCSRCGTAAPQISPLYLRANDAPRGGDVWQTLDQELLVRPGVRDLLERATGVEFRQVLSAESGEPLPWFQLIPIYELPPMSAGTEGIYQDPQFTCPQCKRDGFGTAASYTIRYELDLDSLPDVCHTFERFGRSVLKEPFSKSHFAQPLTIVRTRVFQLLKEAGVRNISVEPIDVVDRRGSLSANSATSSQSNQSPRRSPSEIPRLWHRNRGTLAT